MASKTRVLLADSQPREMKQIATRLNEGARFEAIADSRGNCSLLGLIGLHRPRIVVDDFPGEEECGIPILEELARLYKGEIRAIAYTECTDYATIIAFIAHGGWGYALKSCPESEILDIVYSVAQGKPLICPHLGWESLHAISTDAPPFRPSHLKKLPNYLRRLTPSFRNGETPEEIADIFNISVKSARLYRQTAMDILGVHTAADLQKGLLLAKLD